MASELEKFRKGLSNDNIKVVMDNAKMLTRLVRFPLLDNHEKMEDFINECIDKSETGLMGETACVIVTDLLRDKYGNKANDAYLSITTRDSFLRNYLGMVRLQLKEFRNQLNYNALLTLVDDDDRRRIQVSYRRMYRVLSAIYLSLKSVILDKPFISRKQYIFHPISLFSYILANTYKSASGLSSDTPIHRSSHTAANVFEKHYNLYTQVYSKHMALRYTQWKPTFQTTLSDCMN